MVLTGLTTLAADTGDPIATWLAPWLGISVGAATVLIALVKLLPKAGGPIARAVERLVIRFAVRRPWIWHPYVRGKAKDVLGTIRGLVLTDLRLPLSDVFVPLAVRLPGVGNRLGETTTLGHLLAEHDAVILKGAAGSGKTTLAAKLVLNNYAPKKAGGGRWTLAVLVRLPELAAAGHTVEEAIQDALAILRGKLKPDRLTKWLVESAITSKNLFLVLDGLDEVPDELPTSPKGPAINREEVRRRLLQFQRAHGGGKNRCLLTCRTSGFRPGELDEFSTVAVDVEPLTDDGIEEFLGKWPEYRGHSVRPLADELKKAEAEVVRIECRTPLLLTLLAETYLAAAVNQDRFELPRSRREFYDNAVRELLQRRPGERGQARVAATYDQKKAILGRVARDRFLADGDGDRERIPGAALRKAVAGEFRTPAEQDRVIAELENENGILQSLHGTAAGRDGAAYLFAHRTFLEYFAAWWLRKTATVHQIINWYGKKPGYEDLLTWYAALAARQDVETLVDSYARGQEWDRAAACLIAGAAIENEHLIGQVVAGLGEPHPDSAQQAQRWGLVAALARRPDRAYEPAHRAYNELLESLVPADSSADRVPALRALLAANPEGFRRLIPQLLDHPTADWGRAAAQLLAEEAAKYGEKDERTRWAVERLVQSLNRPPEDPTRRAAATRLSSLFAKRGHLIADSKALLPEAPAEAAQVWPLDPLFPARVVWPVLIALADRPSEVEDPVIRVAVGAYNEAGRPEGGKLARAWARVAADDQTARAIRTTIALAAGTLAAAVALASATLVVATVVGVLWHFSILLTTENRLTVADRDQLAAFERVAAAASDVHATVDKHVPKITTFQGIGPQGQAMFREKVRLQGQDRVAYDLIDRLKGLSGAVYETARPDETAYEFYRQMKATDEQLDALRTAMAALPDESHTRLWRDSVAVPTLWLLDIGRVWALLVIIALLFFLEVVGGRRLAVVLDLDPDRPVHDRSPRRVHAGFQLNRLGRQALVAFGLSLVGSILLFCGGWGTGRLAECGALGGATALAYVGIWLALTRRLHWNRLVDLVPIVRGWAVG